MGFAVIDWSEKKMFLFYNVGDVREGGIMKLRNVFIVCIVLFGFFACSTPVKVKTYPISEKFSPTNPRNVKVLRQEPKRRHIQLGEIIIDHNPSMSRRDVQRIMKENAAGMGAQAVVVVVDKIFRRDVVRGRFWRRTRVVRDKVIVGIAIRFQRRRNR